MLDQSMENMTTSIIDAIMIESVSNSKMDVDIEHFDTSNEEELLMAGLDSMIEYYDDEYHYEDDDDDYYYDNAAYEDD